MSARSLVAIACSLVFAACATHRQKPAPAANNQPDLNNPADRKVFIEKVQESMRSGQFSAQELTVQTRKGEVYVIRPDSVTRVK
jgi:hypothetical protein